MKITKKDLRIMILEEFSTVVSNYGGEEQQKTNYRHGQFDSMVATVFQMLEKMEEIVRNQRDLHSGDLDYFKTYHLERLMDKIGMIEGAIDARVAGKFDEVE